LNGDKLVLFDCDNFNELNYELKNQISNVEKGENKNFMYPGPYKIVIFEDGSVLRRGAYSTINKKWWNDCLSLGCKEINSENHTDIKYYEPNMIAATLGEDEGIEKEIQIEQKDEYDLSSLNNLSQSIKGRLKKMIELNHEYLILTGSDPIDEFGCCPSQDVGYANRLAESGVLSKKNDRNNHEDCPINTYAFRDEINQNSQKINDAFRMKVLDKLNNKSKGLSIIKVLLLSVIVLSILLSIAKEFLESENDILLKNIIPDTSGTSYHLILLHANERCEMCLNMEEFSKEFQVNYLSKKKIDLVLCDFDQKRYKNIVEKNDIFTSTMFLIIKKDNEVVYKKMLSELWELFKSKEKFKSALELELNNSGY
jgi:hypothetical protein